MKSDRLVSIIILVILTGLYLITLGFPPEAAMYPKALLAFIALLTIVMFIKPGNRETSRESFLLGLQQNLPVIIVAMLIGAFILLIEPLGLYLVLPFFTASVMFSLGLREIKEIVTVPITLTLIVYLIFTIILKVPVPMGLLE